MELAYKYVADLAEQEIPGDGILSRTLHDDAQVKAVVFAFGVGQQLSEHTAAVPAMLYFVKGEARLSLGGDELDVRPGAWVHMPAQMPHSVQAVTPLVMLLLLLRRQADAKP